MKIIILSRYYNKGGAGIAARRIFDALYSNQLFNIVYVTPQNIEFHKSIWSSLSKLVFNFFEKIIFKFETFLFFFLKINKPLRSFNFFGLFNARYFNNMEDVKIINIHWINGGCISLSNIYKLRKTVILTLHDSWLINGTSHYPAYINEHFEKKFNIFQIFLLKKIEYYFRIYKRKNISNVSCIIAPSTWLYNLLLSDNYFSKFPIYKIPNPLNLSIYKPANKEYKLKNKFKIIAFHDNKLDFLKGSDLLHHLIFLFNRFDDIEFHLIGNNLDNIEFASISNVVLHGFISDEIKLVELYNSVDLCISTSRSENLSQFLTQACACSLPLVAFNVGGNSDIINDGGNGYLIKPFEIGLFVSKIFKILNNPDLLYSMRSNSLNISKSWDSKLIAGYYQDIFIKYKNDK